MCVLARTILLINLHTGKLVCPDDSAEILVRLVSGELKYENGGRLDYYDLLK